MTLHRAWRATALFWLTGWLLSAGTVPGRYIVELKTEPVVDHMVRLGGRGTMRSALATEHRSRVRAEQQQVRGALSSQVKVLNSIDTVGNALFVQVPDDQVQELAKVPGVLKVHPVREVHMVLDRAVALSKVTDAWSQIGMDRAGAGIKIGIIDSGIDSSHPGFQDASLPIPDGFPRTTFASDQSRTNNKIIVARSYVELLPSRDPDYSAADHVGHGTALAMIAAGVQNSGPLATMTGVAPKAYLGSYKVFGTPGYNDSTTDDAILKAIDDAVTDGMDVINLSLGSALAPRLEDDVEVQAMERAFKAGVIVVVAAGNEGPDLNTMASPGTAPSAITVGASRNDRTFAASITIGSLPPFVAIASDGSAGSTAEVSGTLRDIAALDGNGLACDSLPSGSLQGKVVLILRGTCTFEAKLNNAQRAGAVGAIVYATAAAPDPFTMSVGAATLPAEMISNEDGLAAKKAVGADESLSATLRFSLSAVGQDPNRLASFSGAGPNVDGSIKPDLVTVGSDVYVATQTYDQNGDMYDSSGYVLVDGTSFSTPLVAGVAALIKSARPGLTPDQYRSLLINTATAINAQPGVPARVQQAGAGQLNADAAYRVQAVVSPTSLNFGFGGTDLQQDRKITLTNLGQDTENYTLEVKPTGEDAAPGVTTDPVTIAAGASQEIPISWKGSNLAAGSHEGVILVRGSSSGMELRIPYWYGVASTTPARITILDAITSARRGGTSRDAVLFRITDASGLPIADVAPQVTVISGGGTVRTISSYDSDVPGLFGLTVRLGAQAGSNVFRIQAGESTLDVTITGQ